MMMTKQEQPVYRVTSYGLAVYLTAAGFESRGAVIEDGRTVYLFDPEAAAVFPAFQAVRRRLDAITREAGVKQSAR
jgi:hypothetical protein